MAITTTDSAFRNSDASIRAMREDYDLDALRRRIEARAAEVGCPVDHVVSIKVRLTIERDGFEEQILLNPADYAYADLMPEWTTHPSGPELLIDPDSDPDPMIHGIERLNALADWGSLSQGLDIRATAFTRRIVGDTLIERQASPAMAA